MSTISDCPKNSHTFYKTEFSVKSQIGCAPNGGYTLEKHLKSFSDEPRYKFLWSNWITEKEINRKRLETVSSTFNTYSSHGADHSEAIILMIESLLGEERIRLLSPTDTWLILQCAYTHDIGMCVGEEEKGAKSDEILQGYVNNSQDIKRLLDSESFRLYLCEINKQSFPDNSMYSALHMSSRFMLRKIQSSEKEKERFIELLKGMEFSKAKNIFSEAVMNYFRRLHAERSRDILLREADDNLYKDIFVSRLRRIIAMIDYSHGTTWEYILKELPQIDNGIHSDYIHPQFIAALLRIGDLLDIDSNRFNPFLLDQVGNIPISSAVHKLKHMSISRLMVNTKYVDIESRYTRKGAEKFLNEYCFNKKHGSETNEIGEHVIKETINNSIKIQRHWLNMISDELKRISMNWNMIIPENMTGSMAMLRINDIYYEDKLIDDDELELRYKISPERASKIIEGAELYNQPLTFIRELVQNAIDSTKKQLYRILCMNFDDTSNIDINQFIERKDVFYNLLKKYRVDVKFTYTPPKFDAASDLYKANPKLTVRICDKGIGITYNKLKKMRNIGDVILSDEEKRYIRIMPQWMKPTGEFGIGMQSVFTVADKFTIHTSPQMTETENDNAKHTITFYCTELGGDIVNVDEKRDFSDSVETDVNFDIEFTAENLCKFFGYSSLYSKRKRMDKIMAPEVIKNKLQTYIEKTFTDDLIGVDFSFEVCDEKDMSKKTDIARFDLPDFKGCYYINKSESVTCLIDYADKNDGTIVFWYNKRDGEDNGHSVLITMKNSNNSSGTIKTYFKGILINEEDDLISKEQTGKLGIFRIPNMDLKVNIMSGKAGDFLEINRDYIKSDGYDIVVSAIQGAFKNFYRTLYNLYCEVYGQNENKIDDTKINIDENYTANEKLKKSELFEKIGTFIANNPDHFLVFLQTVRTFESDFDDKNIIYEVSKMANNNIKINVFATVNNTIYLDRLNYSELNRILKKYKIYYTKRDEIIYDVRNCYTIRENKYIKEDIIAIEDRISLIYDLGYKKAFALKSIQLPLTYQLIYTLSEANSFTDIDDESYKIICQNTLKHYIEEYINTGKRANKGDMFPSFPATERYKNIALSKIMAESADELADGYNRFILLPFNIALLSEVYDSENNNFSVKWEVSESLNLFSGTVFSNIYKTIISEENRSGLSMLEVKTIYVKFFKEVLDIEII